MKEETEETDCEEVSLKDKIAHQYNYEHNILENTTYENTMDDNAAADDFFEGKWIRDSVVSCFFIIE